MFLASVGDEYRKRESTKDWDIVDNSPEEDLEFSNEGEVKRKVGFLSRETIHAKAQWQYCVPAQHG